MARFHDPLVAADFSTGVATYEDFYPGDEGNARIVLSVVVAGQVNTQAVVDTGTPWCILDPQLVKQAGVSPDSGYAPAGALMIRGVSYKGRLHRISIGLRNEREGNDLEVPATVFVPAIPQGEPWPHPNFLGLIGLLDRIRFAVDPAENALYFGPL
jgi:predicted aspartyl protease